MSNRQYVVGTQMTEFAPSIQFLDHMATPALVTNWLWPLVI